MSYVCEALDLINGVQTCVQWATYTEPDLFKSIAINGEQSRTLYYEFSKLLALFVCFAFVAKATKLL